MTVKIVQKENLGLRKEAQEVPQELFGTTKLKKIIKDMSEALAKEDDGVALAAPQINLPLRLFVVSGKIFMNEDELASTQTPKGSRKIKPDLIFINPTLTSLSKKKEEMEEGCLSVRWLYGQVKRATKATVTAYDVEGKKFTHSGSGLLAQIFQHEMDHLDGVLFIDKTKEVKEYHPEPKQ
jgi:peptide deformylase